MANEPLDELLRLLTEGDDAAAERVFLAYEPYLRKVVRRQLPRQLRAKLDSIDVVQSVWVHLLPGFREASWRFASPEQLLAFLVTVTRNRLTDRVRHFHRAIERERPLKGADADGLAMTGQPRPSEVAQANDLWDRMLALCPPEHHELLRLRRQGLQLAEIAARTGLHEGSVRRILRKLARQLAFDAPPE